MLNKLDILFVNPDSSAKAYQGLATVYSAVEPPTWALLLAESCRSNGFGVGLLDCDAEKLSIEQAVRRIEELRARLVVFVVYGQNPNSGTTSMIGACELASQLRSSHPEIKIGFIGSHVSALPLEVVQLPYVDIAFINEGVHALLALLKSDLDGVLDKIPGIWYKDKSGVPRPGAPGIVVSAAQMDTLMPGYAWDLLPRRSEALDLYRAHFWHTDFLHENRTPFAAIYTSLGCQFSCNFCMINIVNRSSYEADSRGMRG